MTRCARLTVLLLSGLVALPGSDAQRVELALTPRGYALATDVFAGKVRWRISRAALTR